MKLVAFAIASLLGLSTAAYADEAYQGPPGAPQAYADYGAPGPYAPAPRQRAQPRARAEIRQAIVARFDRDGDGRLNPQERRHAARALRKLARKIARNERRAARQDRRGDLRGEGPARGDVQVDVNW